MKTNSTIVGLMRAAIRVGSGFGIFLAMLTGMSGAAVAEPAASGTMAVQLDISTRTLQPLNPLVHGFNTNLSKVPWR